MELQDLQEAVHKEPFHPFIIRLSDGRAMQVVHPDFIAISSSIVIVIAADERTWSYIDPFLIVSLDFQRELQKKKR